VLDTPGGRVEEMARQRSPTSDRDYNTSQHRVVVVLLAARREAPRSTCTIRERRDESRVNRWGSIAGKSIVIYRHGRLQVPPPSLLL
jgi:hypothetical protein